MVTIVEFIYRGGSIKNTLERNKNGPIFGLEEKFETGLDGIVDTYDFKFGRSEIYTNQNILLEQFALAREEIIDEIF